MKTSDDPGRRAFLLKELGLSPVWVRRNGAANGDAPAAVAATSTPMKIPVGAAPPDDRAAQIAAMDWAQLKSSAATCTACVLHKARKQAVLGVGDVKAEWLFVGEGPGAEEDERGEPFVGQAGKLLDNMLSAIALKRGQNVYIANVVKCRPPGNRTPEPAEAQACEAYLTRQIDLIRPKLIIALGKVAAQNLLGIEATLGSMRGRVHDYRGTPLIVTYHPAYLLRNLVDKSKSWEDLCFAVDTMQSLKPRAVAPN
ncbi:MAG TPA: uracil-DNA glycosylase [Burkholderiales bacterium]|nr:uracil-DNA glycosylase [Burkholderiales bacterium]